MKNERGMTLMEVLSAVLVLSILVTAMATGMDLAMQTYRQNRFATESEAVADILHTTLGDILRFSRITEITEDGIVFSNAEYGLYDCRVELCEKKIVLNVSDRLIPLVNEGVYGGLEVCDFKMQYSMPDEDTPQPPPNHPEIFNVRSGVVYIRITLSGGGFTWNSESVVQHLLP